MAVNIFDADLLELLNEYGAGIVDDLKNDIDNKRVTPYGAVNASGRLKNSLKYDVMAGVLQVSAVYYVQWVENGRGKGKRPPIAAIEQWITDKGLIIQDISKRSLAFLIARKIAEQGTVAYRQGGTKLVEGVIAPELKNELRSRLAKLLKDKTVAKVRSSFIKL